MAGQERPHVGQPHRQVGPVARVGQHVGELALHLADLPAVVAVDGRQRGDAVAQRLDPGAQRVGAGEPVAGGVEAGDVLRQPPGELDPVAADVVERQRRAEPGASVVGQSDPGEDPVDAELPGVVDDLLEPEGRTVLAVEAPPHARLAHPVGDRVEIVVGEAEAPPHRRRLGQVEHLAGGSATAGQVEQRGGNAEERVGLGERPVGEPHPQPVGRMTAGHDLTEAEARRDQRRVGLDVGAHDEDVARLEGRIVLEQAQQHLAQHVDLAGRAVTAVHLDRPVRHRQRATRRPDRVGAQVGLEPAEQRVGRGGARVVMVEGVERREPALELAQVAAQRREQRVADAPVPDVVASRHGPGQVAGRPPLRLAGVREPQVEVVVRRERRQQVEVGRAQPRVAEEREPGRQVDRPSA